ncbi:MAG: MarR family winged helix-turn-helix transcriptional regulator [Anaerolineales bacterium]
MTMKPFIETLGYQLVQLCKAHRNRAEALLNEIGLHTGQEMLLMHLWLHDGCAQTDLGDKLCVQPATITKSLDRLEAAGFVQRRADADDRRVSRVYLTDAGRALQKKVDTVWQELETLSFGPLTSAEQETLHRLIAKVRERLVL